MSRCQTLGKRACFGPRFLDFVAFDGSLCYWMRWCTSARGFDSICSHCMQGCEEGWSFGGVCVGVRGVLVTDCEIKGSGGLCMSVSCELNLLKYTHDPKPNPNTVKSKFIGHTLAAVPDERNQR